MLAAASARNQASGSVQHYLQPIDVAGGNAIQYGVAIVQSTGNERVNKGSLGFERQATSNTAQLSKLVKTAADDVVDMDCHC